jgi:hypothetical protein
MKRFRDFHPSAWDSKANYVGQSDHNHWYVFNIMKTRDAELLTESNWDYICKELEPDKIAGCEVHNFGHWACGHYDLILIHPWHKKLLERARELEKQLDNYPILDEDDYSARCEIEIDRQWDDFAREDFISELSEYTELDLTEYSSEQIDSLYYFMQEISGTYRDSFTEDPCFHIEDICRIYGTTITKEVYMPWIFERKVKNFPISDTMLDRVMNPKKYHEPINQIKLFE